MHGNSKKVGDAGYRSPYLSHAKRALYHVSYVPRSGGVMCHTFVWVVVNGPILSDGLDNAW